MKILFSGASSGWSEYMLNGTKAKPRNLKDIKIIDGDLELTKAIYSQPIKTKNSYTRVVLAFQGKLDDEKMEKVYQDFKKEFMQGFNENEYNISAVIHKDSSNDHIHICIPKKNLDNGKNNDYYYDKQDRHRVNLIRDYLIKKHNLPEVKETTKELDQEEKELSKIERLEKWRKSNNQKIDTLSLKTKRSKIKAEKSIKNHIKSLYENGLIENIDETKEAVENLGLKVSKIGYDKPADFHYFTIEMDGKKYRIKGEMFDEQFYSGKNQGTRTRNYSRNESEQSKNLDTQEQLRKKLDRANTKRISIVSKRNHRATRTRDKEQRINDNHNISNLGNSDRSSSNNHNQNDILKEKTNDEHIEHNQYKGKSQNFFESRERDNQRDLRNIRTIRARASGTSRARKTITGLSKAITNNQSRLNQSIESIKRGLQDIRKSISSITLKIKSKFSNKNQERPRQKGFDMPGPGERNLTPKWNRKR